MKNRRILTKILLLVLTLATVIGAFAISGSAIDATKTLVEGIDFDGLAAAEPSSTTRDNIYNETGLYFDTNANVAVQETPGDEGNMRLYFNNGANYIRPTFKKNDALLELLFTENGPKTFKLELDLAINNAFAGTAEANDAKKNAITTQRGFSVLNIGTNWLFKATAPGAGTVNVKEGVTVNDKGVVTEGGKYLYVESVNPGTENVGYFYKDAKNYYFPASAKMGWADAKYTGSTEGAISEGGKTYVAGYANVAASNAALQAVSYTVGVPQHFVLSFTRTEVAGDNNDTMNVQVHVDEKLLVSSSTYTLNATNYKDGFRITDISGVGVSIDNFKVVLPTEDNNCQSGAHTSVDGWADTKVEFENAGDNAGVIYKVVCKDCGEIVNTDIYPNVIKTYGDIVGKTSAQFLEGFRSDVWDNYKNTPFWLSFDWTVNQLPTTNKSILAWRGNTKDGNDKNDVYVWPLRLWEDGTVKMRVQNPAEAYVNFATPFKVSVGNTYRIDVRFDLAHSTFDVFADGVYLDTGYHSRLSSTNKEVGAYPMIRFIEASTGKHDFTNIVITRGVTPENHKHNTSLNDEFDKTTVSLADGNKVVYTYPCYCGETVTKGISEVTHDSLVPVFGNEGAVVAVENATIPTTDFTIIGKINARELPAEKADFITVGEQVLVSIGADGKLYIGENAIEGAEFAAGRDYHEVAVYFDVDSKLYCVYFEGKNVASAEYTELSGDLVFFAENGGVYNLERAVFATLEEGKDNTYKLGESDHVHYVVDASESGLTLKGHGLTATVEYTCAGCYVDVTEPVKNSEFLAVPLVDAYDFSVIVSPVANEESYWVFFDANNRAVIENGVLVKVGDAVLAEYKDGEIVGYNDVASGVKADKVGIHSIAVRVAAEDYMLYVDGKLVTTADVAELAEGLGDTLELGGAGCEKVRFNELLIVNFGATDEPFVYEWLENDLRPCYHGNATTLYDIKIVVGNGVVYKSAICGDCGEKAKIGLNNLLTEDNGPGWVNNTLLNGESITFSNYKGIRVSPDIIGSKGIPYIVEFDLDVDVINENTIRFDGANVRKNGRILFGTYADASATVSNNYFQHFLRLFVVPDETTADANDYIDGKAYLRIGESEDKSPLVTTIEEGHSYHFAMYVDPVNRKITVNSWDLNDESTFRVTNGTINNIGTQRSDYRFRFLDGGWGTFTVNQFAFYNNDTSGDVFHTHSDEWLTNDENTNTTIIRTEDHKLAYSYECYCGQTVTYGISEVIKESVMPAYGITGEKVVISAFEIPENDFWLVGDISAMKLPAEDGKALVTIGDKVLLGINKDGELASDDGVGCAVKLVADDEYHSLAFRFDVSKKAYTVYLDGAYVTDASYKTLAGDVNVKIASEGAGKYHFDQVAVVVLAEDGDIAYKVAEGAHTHHYDPETSSLEFNAERSSITINYTCVECDRPAFDGISENLYDADNSQMILPVFGTEEKVVEGELLTSAAPYWFSFDAVLKSELAQGRGSVFKFVDEENNEISILTMYTDGALFDAEGNEIARLGKTKTNVTVNVIENEGEYSYRLYIDGVYLGEYELALDGEKSYAIALGAEFATTLEATEIKFAKMANGGELEISTFTCGDDEHVNVINTNTRVEYLDVNAFSFIYRCARCGKTVTEQINKSFYEATPHVYTAQGAHNAEASEEKGDSYWIVADVNVRGYLGGFRSFVPLISDGEVAALLINSEGELMLADGTKVYRALKSKSTYNVALKYEDGVYYLFLDGAYAGCTTGTSFKQGITHGSSNEYFGSPELNNIRYYNIKVVTTGVTDEPVRVQFIEDASVLPCAHEHHSFHDVTVMLDEQIKEVYICSKCGERVLRVNNKDILNSTSNAFIENGSFTASGSKFISSEEKYLSVEAAPYWVRFTVEFTDFASPEHINSANEGKGRQNGVTLFGTKSGNAYGHILRMVTPEIGVDKFADGVVEIRGGGNRNAPLITTVYEGDIHEFVIGVVPSSGKTVIYMDGEFVFERNTPIYKTGRSDYGFRFLDHTSGTFNVTNFEFVTAGGHTHTAKYAQYIDGGYDVLAYTESTLTHRYTCYCGAEIEEGIDRIYVDPITKVDGATDFTAINDGEEITMGADPYWFSVKVSINGSANVFSYGKDELMVETNSDGYFVVDGVTTGVAYSNDYDIVSVMVDPVTGEYDVYVNGSYLASGDAGFKQNKNFNILLGGAGSDVAYSNLKLVGLKDGATGEVANCGDHSFKNSGMVIKYVATEGKITSLTYVCSFCGEEVIRTVTPDTVVYQTGMNTGGNRVVIRSDPKTTEGSDEIKYDTDYFDELVDMNYEGSRWLTFEAKPIDLKIKEGKNNAFVCWVYDYNHGLTVDPATGKTPDGTAYSRFFRAYYVDDKTVEVRITRGGTNHVAAIGSPTMTEGKTYKFAIEYFTSTGVYYAYMSEADSDVLKFIGEGKLAALDYSVKGNPNKDGADKNEEYGIRFGDGNIGNVTISNVNVFNGTVADRPVEDTSIEIKSHFPADNAPGKMSYVDGQIYHEFDCGCGCGETIKNTVLNSLQNPALNGNKVVTEVLNVSGPKPLYVDEELVTYGGKPYYFAFELTPDKINVSDIKRKNETNKNGASILAILSTAAGTDPTYLDLLRAYYRDGRVVLDSPLDTGNEFELAIEEGVTYNFVFAVNPTDGKLVCSVKVENIDPITVDFNGAITVPNDRESYHIRFLDNNGGTWGIYDFTNIKIGYMVDECARKTCVEAGGKKTYICDDCGNTAFAAHNYNSVVDSTGKWTLYKCEDCKEVFVVFNDISLIADLEFATYDELMEYLVMEYPPMFIRIME